MTMGKLAIAVAAAALAGCAQLAENREPPAASGMTYQEDTARPRWLRDPVRGEYPYNAPWF
jgi:hypothetical protein